MHRGVSRYIPGIPSERDGARWHDIDFKYDAICAAPDAVSACIETLINSVANPLLTMSKSGGLRFSCRVPDYLHPNADEAKQYIHKHAPTSENPNHRDVYLEILGDEGYSRWDARYEILIGNLLDPPVITKEVLFAPIDTLRAALHEPAPPPTNNLESIPQASAVLPLVPPLIDEKIVAVREGKLSPLAIKRPSPVLDKLELMDLSRQVPALHVLEHDVKTGWLCAVDETGTHLPFLEIRILKDILDAWNINQQGTALGNFASALLHALKHKGGPYENPVRRVRMVMQAFEEQEKTLVEQMSEQQTFWHQLKRFFAHYKRRICRCANEYGTKACAAVLGAIGSGCGKWISKWNKKYRIRTVGGGENRIFQIRTSIYVGP